jgi:hypothetical protein
VCVLAAFKYQRPNKILFHTDVDSFDTPYWVKVKNTPGTVYGFRNVTLPDKIFGQKLSKKYFIHYASDVTRIRIMI